MNPRITEAFVELLARREEKGSVDFRRVRRFALHEADFARLWVTHALGSGADVGECATALVFLASGWDGPQTRALLADLDAWWRPRDFQGAERLPLTGELDERAARLPDELRGRLEGIVAGLSRLEAFSGARERLGESPAEIVVSGLSAPLLAALQERARPALKPATVNHRHMDRAIRDSSDAFLPVPTRDPVVATVERVMARCANMALAQAEPLVVLRYEPGQQYRWHRDYRPPDQPGGPREIEQFGQRVHTAILYLNDDYEGGETEFRDWQFTVNGRPGRVLSFPSVDADGREDPSSVHRGTPVLNGEKWIATLWFRGRKLWHRRGLL